MFIFIQKQQFVQRFCPHYGDEDRWWCMQSWKAVYQVQTKAKLANCI